MKRRKTQFVNRFCSVSVSHRFSFPNVDTVQLLVSWRCLGDSPSSTSEWSTALTVGEQTTVAKSNKRAFGTSTSYMSDALSESVFLTNGVSFWGGVHHISEDTRAQTRARPHSERRWYRPKQSILQTWRIEPKHGTRRFSWTRLIFPVRHDADDVRRN